MSDLVSSVRREVPPKCLARSYRKDGCSISMAGVPADHLTVDLDCSELRLPAERKRCDFVFIGEDEDNAWVVPIELKSGNFRPDSVAAQLLGGADLVVKWLPKGAEFTFVPVVAHGKGIRKEKLKALRRAFVTLRGQRRLPTLIRCHSQLKEVLVAE